jgi:hypothetical protein
VSAQVVTMVIDEPGVGGEAAHERLAEQLPEADVGAPDPDTGVFDVSLDADSREEALTRVFDAVAAAGADDELVFLEHPDVPEHWRSRPA